MLILVCTDDEIDIIIKWNFQRLARNIFHLNKAAAAVIIIIVTNAGTGGGARRRRYPSLLPVWRHTRSVYFISSVCKQTSARTEYDV